MKRIIATAAALAMIAAVSTSYAAGTAGSACDINSSYVTAYSCGFENGESPTVFGWPESGDTPLTFESKIIEDTASNHAYSVKKIDQNVGTAAAVFTADMQANAGKYLVSYDLKVPETVQNTHLVALKASSYADAAETIINGTTGNGTVLNVIRAGNSNEEQTHMTASYASVSVMQGGNWDIFSEIGFNPTVNLDYNTWNNVKVLIDTKAGTAQYYYNDAYIGEQTNNALKQGVKVLQIQTYQGWESYKEIQIDNITIKKLPIISYDFSSWPNAMSSQIGSIVSDNGNNVLQMQYETGKDVYAFISLGDSDKIPANSGKYVLEYDLKYFESWNGDKSVLFYCQAVCGDGKWYPMNAVREWGTMKSRLTYGANVYDIYGTADTYMQPKNGEWMNIRVEIDTDNNTADYYFDNIYAGRQEKDWAYNQGITNFVFQIGENGNGQGTVYIDNISLKKAEEAFYADGDNVSVKRENGSAKASYTVVNTGSTLKSCALIFAAYDGDGRLVNCVTKTLNAQHLLSKDTLTLDNVSEGQTVKAFVWDSLDGELKNLIQ